MMRQPKNFEREGATRPASRGSNRRETRLVDRLDAVDARAFRRRVLLGGDGGDVGDSGDVKGHLRHRRRVRRHERRRRRRGVSGRSKRLRRADDRRRRSGRRRRRRGGGRRLGAAAAAEGGVLGLERRVSLLKGLEKRRAVAEVRNAEGGGWWSGRVLGTLARVP